MSIFYSKMPSSTAGKTYVITLSASSQQTSTFGPQTLQIRVATSSLAAFVQIGNNPTATSASSQIVGTNVVDYFQVTPGQQAALLGAGSTGSTVTVTEMG